VSVGWSVVGELRCVLAESPVWDDTTGRLMLVDVPSGAVCAVDPATGVADRVTYDRPLTAIVPRADGTWVGVSGHDIGALEPDTVAFRTVLTLPSPTDVLLNDAVCGRGGDLFVGSVDRSGSGRGVLFAVAADRRHRVVARGVHASNGVDTSPDGRILYHADTFAGTVTAYGPDARPLRTTRVEGPDGLAVDAEGCVWVALWGAGKIRRYTRTLTPDRTVRVPAPLVTNVAFGGRELRTMFVTTARSADVACSGAVFAADVNAQGLPPPLWRPA
jgi:xylono-1,5-lactonase